MQTIETSIEILPIRLCAKYFSNDVSQYNFAKLMLVEKFKDNDYDDSSISQPFTISHFKNRFPFYCKNESDLIGSILYLSTKENKYLINDLDTIPSTENIIWNEMPIIESIAAAEHLYQTAKKKITYLLNTSKILKKDVSGILKLIEPLKGARYYKDVQYIYYMLYCELRITLQLLKLDKDFDLSFSFYKEWLDLRKNDVHVLRLLSKTSLEEYYRNTFKSNIIKNLKNVSFVVGPNIKIQLIPSNKTQKKNVIIIDKKRCETGSDVMFDFLYYLLWLKTEYPNKQSAIKTTEPIPSPHIKKITDNDESLNRFTHAWNTDNDGISKAKNRVVGKLKKLLRFEFKIDLIINFGDSYLLIDKFHPDNIIVDPFKTVTK